MSATNDEWFLVKDLEGFIDATRKLVFDSYGDNNKTENEEYDVLSKLSQKDQQELDEILSYNEAKTIVLESLKSKQNRKTKKINYYVNDNTYMKIMMSLGDRMTSNLLNSLVNKGFVESAYDAEKNDFVFWVKEQK